MNRHINRFISSALILGALSYSLLSFIPSPALAGGTISVSRGSISDATTGGQKGYILNPSWKNDDIIPLSLVFSDGQILSMQPGQTVTRNIPATLTYYVQDYVGTSSKATVFAPLTKVGSTPATISLSWGQAEPAYAYSIKDYSVFRNFQKIADTTATSLTDSGLTADTSYTYYVQVNYTAISGPAYQTNTLTASTDKVTAVLPTPVATTTPTPTSSSRSTTSQAATPSPTPSATATPSTGVIAATQELTSATNLTVAKENILVEGKQANPSQAFSTSSDTITVSGKAAPNTLVTITLHSKEVTFTTTADAGGNWSKAISLASLEKGNHSITATYEKDGVKSENTEIATFVYNKPLDKTFLTLIIMIGLLVAGWVTVIVVKTRKKNLIAKAIA